MLRVRVRVRVSNLGVGVPVLLAPEDALTGDGPSEQRLHRVQVRALGVRLSVREPLVRHEVEVRALVLPVEVEGDD